VKEALFTLRLEAHPRYDLGKFKSIVTLKMEAICPSETSALITRVTPYKQKNKLRGL
jgi:hypothetical protein